MDLSFDKSFDDSETLLTIAVQSLIKSNGSSPSIEAVVKHGKTEWSFSIAQQLTTFLVSQIVVLDHKEDLINLFSQVLDFWADEIIYTTTVDVLNLDGFSLLSILTDILLSEKSASAASAISKIWLVLERLQHTVSWQVHPVDVWWVDTARDWKTIVQIGLQVVLQTQCDKDNSTRCSYMILLTLLLQYNIFDWISVTPSDVICKVASSLIQDASIWQHGDDEHSLQRKGLLAIRLINVIQMNLADDVTTDFDTMANSTSLVENILHVALPNEANTPLWATNFSSNLRPLARNVLISWNQSQSEAWAGVLAHEGHWGTFIVETWKKIMEGGSLPEVHALQGILVMHKMCPSQPISDVEFQESVITERLLDIIQEDDAAIAACAAALCRLLFLPSIPPQYNNGDAIDAWNIQVFGSNLLSIYVDAITKRTHVSPALIILLLDVLDRVICRSNKNFVENTFLEQLIDLMNVSENESDVSIMEEFTPQANNLSCIHDECFCGIQPPQKVKSQEMERLASVAAATAVAHIAPKANHLTRSRIQRALHNYISEFQDRKDVNSYELHRRFIRLEAFYGSQSEIDEETVATNQWRHMKMQKTECDILTQDNLELIARNESLMKQIERMGKDLQEMQRSFASRDITLQRRINSCRKGFQREASTLVARLQQEQLNSERRAIEAEKRMEISEAKIAEAQDVAKQCKANEAAASISLRNEKVKVEELERLIVLHQTTDSKHQAEISNLQSRLKDTFVEIESKDIELAKSRKSAQEKETLLLKSSRAFTELHAELDSAYGKLVCLAQAFELTEKESEETIQKIDREARQLKKKLQDEIRRNDKLDDENGTLQRDNERLVKKLERSRQQLAVEQQERNEEKQRRRELGPVSYINDLHRDSLNRSMTMNYSKLHSSRSSRSKASSDRDLSGKENSISSSRYYSSRTAIENREFDG